MWTVTLDGKSVLALALATIGCVTLALSATDAADAGDATRRAPRDTHMLQSLDDFVVLRLTDFTGTPKFVRVDPDGTQATDEFEVPEGRRLVVTDVDYFVRTSLNSASAVLRLRLENKTTSTKVPVYLSPVEVLGQSISGSGGTKEFGATTGIDGGFVVDPGARLVADIVKPFDVTKSQTVAFTETLSEVLLRGYLANAR
jgi:hypothetical protein